MSQPYCKGNWGWTIYGVFDDGERFIFGLILGMNVRWGKIRSVTKEYLLYLT